MKGDIPYKEFFRAILISALLEATMDLSLISDKYPKEKKRLAKIREEAREFFKHLAKYMTPREVVYLIGAPQAYSVFKELMTSDEDNSS